MTDTPPADQRWFLKTGNALRAVDDVMDPYRKLREAAERATPGPWSRTKPATDADGWSTGCVVAATPGRQTIYANPPSGSFPSADADFIALANPAAILALLAERDRLEADLNDYGRINGRFLAGSIELSRHLEQAERALRKSEERAASYADALIECRAALAKSPRSGRGEALPPAGTGEVADG